MRDATLRFEDSAAEQLLSAYMTPDMLVQREEVLRLLQLKPGEHVLDIGSGPGFLASEMAGVVGATGEVSGVDISPELLALAERRYRHQAQLRFLQADASKLPFADDSFDAIVVTQVLEYLRDVHPALLEMRRVLRPGGRILILDTDWDSIVWHSRNTARMQRILAAWDEHLVDPFLPRTLAPKMREAGLTVQERKIIPLFNPEFGEDSFSNRMIDMIGSYVVGRHGVTAEEVDAWAQELRALGRQGEYFFSLNRYVFIGVKT